MNHDESIKSEISKNSGTVKTNSDKKKGKGKGLLSKALGFTQPDTDEQSDVYTESFAEQTLEMSNKQFDKVAKSPA
jgi:hypothetical protein